KTSIPNIPKNRHSINKLYTKRAAQKQITQKVNKTINKKAYANKKEEEKDHFKTDSGKKTFISRGI
ncbi:MAG TPA: hypothetical protein PKV80_24485, partial [Leptospiraceae bacterium]|nr:hypothetical protein [Leptospiraceae bacterium]